ncbi:MAG: malto-oligosyltrehalose synthase [Acidobacteria bacterium RIFCSPLOWO2_12_FULL_54_10]|nr:MAG: malto-oligosyltrehalose synthase [Acidobacteria bacterium RIFCSPLOWO2_12_FULL_54_10]
MTAPIPARAPVSSYRLQFHAGFTFQDATALLPYLSRLGITECYCSPLLAARSHSPHGYDISDHTRLNPELGSEADFEDFSAALSDHNLGLILDFVPNHMAVDPVSNRWWRDVLENGPSSPYAHFFDIDWDPVKPELMGKILLPILGEQYGVALENGQIQIRFQEGEFSLYYFELNLPLNFRATRVLLRHKLESLEATCGPEDPHLREFLSILFQLDHMPGETETDPALVQECRRERQVAQERLARLVQNSPVIHEQIEQNVQTFNGVPGKPESYDLLHDLLELQPYRLSYWHTAQHEINYRRFFDINDLAGIRMEDPDVFEAAHGLVLRFIRRGVVTGLRLDHVDGLFDPAEYFKQLAENCAGVPPIYAVAEKILSTGEPLRQDWAIHGTTGYDFLNDLNGLFVDSQNAQRFKKLYARFVESDELFFDVVYESKKLIIMTSMASELNMLARELNRISEANRRYRDFTLDSLQEALREVVACFPVYRTYLSPRGWDEFDQKSIDTALARALRRNPAMEASVFRFIREMLLPDNIAGLPPKEYQDRVQFAMKFQQYTGPLQAKGLEDTAFYRHGPLISLNEVGGDPARFGRSPAEFHQANLQRREFWPLTMMATTTHDTKRGEDGRARVNVLSEIPDLWRANLARWARTNAGMRTLLEGKPAPDRSDEYLFYQALLSAWPADAAEEPEPEFVERTLQFMQKAIKEKKLYTSWIRPSEEYDSAMASFVRHALTGSGSKRFLRLFLPFHRRIAWLGMLNSLAQVVLKLSSPGVPDFFQGTELWDLSFVDPDNRRPVDFGRRRCLLEKMEPLLGSSCPDAATAAVEEMLARWQDGRIKLYLTAAGLRLRRKMAALFLEGNYLPLSVAGQNQEHVVAFARNLGAQSIIAVVPRLVARLTGESSLLPVGQEVWKETTIALPAELTEHVYQNVLTHIPVLPAGPSHRYQIPVAAALNVCPVAILRGEREPNSKPASTPPALTIGES